MVPSRKLCPPHSGKYGGVMGFITKQNLLYRSQVLWPGSQLVKKRPPCMINYLRLQVHLSLDTYMAVVPHATRCGHFPGGTCHFACVAK